VAVERGKVKMYKWARRPTDAVLVRRVLEEQVWGWLTMQARTENEEAKLGAVQSSTLEMV
jgi:hypothetical protein